MQLEERLNQTQTQDMIIEFRPTIDSYLPGTTVLYSESKKIIQRKGTIETVIPKFIGNDTIKVYYNPFTGKTDVGYQNCGEKHREYSRSERIINIERGSKS